MWLLLLLLAIVVDEGKANRVEKKNTREGNPSRWPPVALTHASLDTSATVGGSAERIPVFSLPTLALDDVRLLPSKFRRETGRDPTPLACVAHDYVH